MKYSIKSQLILTFLGLIVVMFGLNLLINNVWLEKFYIRQKQADMVQIYDQINKYEDYADYQTESFDKLIQGIQDRESVDMIILKPEHDGSAAVIYESRDDLLMRGRIEGYFRGFIITDDTQDVLRKTDRYRIQKFHDSIDHMDYLESFGVFENGCYFLLRLPIQSIRENVKIANKFTTYIILAGILLSIIMVWWLSRRISKPVQELTAISKRMANLDFDAKYMSGGKNEIGQLGENFNQMSDTLERVISELKTANNELQMDLEKKVQLDEMRKEFLSNVSHELKTPIALIQGYAEGLQECINDDEQSREFYCEVIVDEASKMNRLVQKLLTLNQLEFGNDVVNMERFDLMELLQGVVQSAGLLADQKDAVIELSMKNAEGESFCKEASQKEIKLPSLYVWGDEFKIEEVATNYVSNALNHVEGDKRILVSAQTQGDKVRVTVFNTGQQIPQEDIDKIWVKFYKVDKARTREYGGSGVGLSIVKAIMDSHHQRFGVSNVSDGVEFWFELENAGKETEER
ncbi:MAG: HAMP domain-containing sensor histidine kinase [Eubacteriales bacterium]|nr:HAMP domain-containing sensor histidine kinase [Eubacteriales bacterium]